MNWIVTIAVLFAGGLHGFTFSIVLAKIFGLHRQNLLIPKRLTEIEEKVSKLMSNTIIITFIIASNIAWTDYFTNPLKTYAGAGLIVGGLMFVIIVLGWLLD